MKTIAYHKMVRDRIPEVIARDGKKAVWHTVDRQEAMEFLTKKLREEAEEYAASREAEELADVLEVVRALAAEQGVSWDELERIRENKHLQRGGFQQRIVLDAVEIP